MRIGSVCTGDTKPCVECGVEMQRGGRKPSQWAKRRFCSLSCAATHNGRLPHVRETRAANGRRRAKADSPADVEAVRSRYRSGLTQREVADELGWSLKRVQGVMSRNGMKPRRAIKRDQTGPNNPTWKGDAAGYQALHLRVQRARGKPSKCSMCGTSDRGRSYDWANLTGRYEDVDDYMRMCRQCHRAYDDARRKRA